MSRASRKLQVGAEVVTDFTCRGLTRHTITKRLAPATSQSRVLFEVSPIIPGTTGGWIDADWFEPAPAATGQSDSATTDTKGDSNGK